MGHLRVLAGVGLYMLLLYLFPIPMMVLFGLITGAWLLFMAYGLLASSPGAGATGGTSSRVNEIDARD